MKCVIFLKGQLLQCLYPKKGAEQAQSPDINVEDEQLDSFTRSSCSGEVTENLELGEMQDPNQRLNIFTDDCNKESNITDADVTSIVVDDVYESKAQDRPESTKTSMLESKVCSLRTDFSHLTSTVENMKAEIVELQKSKLSSSVELTEQRDSNVQHENATASTCDQYDDESILLRCKDIHDILAYFPEMELIREDLTIICRVCTPKNTTTLSCPTGSALAAGMFSVRESMDERDTDIMSRAFRNLKISISRYTIVDDRILIMKMRYFCYTNVELT